MREFWPNGMLPHIFEEHPICRRESIAAASGTELYPFGGRKSEEALMISKLGEQILQRLGQ
jgi:hypothetical protein